jgi:hypothetical protein
MTFAKRFMSIEEHGSSSERARYLVPPAAALEIFAPKSKKVFVEGPILISKADCEEKTHPTIDLRRL